MSGSTPEKMQLGRLLVVPLVIVLAVVGCAVLVVLFFGAIASPKDIAVQDLLAQLESGTGQRVAGMLMPRDKEMWQAAQELALRLENPEAEIPADEMPEIRRRLTNLLRENLPGLDQQHDTTRGMVYFTMHAAAKAGAAEAVPVLVDVALNSPEEMQREALRALAEMGSVPEARGAAGRLVPLLDAKSDVVRVFACLVLANLAAADNEPVCQALLQASRRLDEAPELRWNAILALARFGYSDPQGWVVQQCGDMLSRAFWQSRRVQYPRSDGSSQADVDRPFSQREIENRLVAAVEAAEHLSDDSVWAQIRTLSNDESLKVSNRARQALASREARTGS
jgi:hypothetical protein